MSERKMKAEINARIQARYEQLMAEGKHGHYETLFQIVHEERALALKFFLDWYDADQFDAVNITRTEMGILVGRHSPLPLTAEYGKGEAG